MITFRTQIENKEYCWFNSSNVLHSEVDLTGKDIILSESVIPGLTGKAVDVKIVFNRGATYLYKNVPVHDYIAFIEHLNRDDYQSSGKSFNKFIKNYSFEKLPETDLNQLDKFKYDSIKFKEIKEIKSRSFDENVSHCFNIMINGNVTDDELIEMFGKEVFIEASEKEVEYIKN